MTGPESEIVKLTHDLLVAIFRGDWATYTKLCAEDITAISSYFKRHAVDKDSTSHIWGDTENPSAGYIAWLLWGGDAGEKWADGIKAKLAKE